MNIEYKFKVKAVKQSIYSLAEIEESNIQCIEIELEIGKKMINRMPPNFRFKNDSRNIIRFLECSFSKDEISSNFKLELIILFPEDITEGNYYIVGDLFFDVFDQQFPGFTAVIDIVRTLQEKNNKLQLVDKFNTIIEFFRE